MQLLAYLIIYPFVWLISILPFRLLYLLSDILYLFLFKIFRYRIKVVEANIRLALPDKTDAEVKSIIEKSNQHFCDMVFEAIKSLTISEKEMKKRYIFTNVEVVKEFENKGRSIIIMCGHYGSWEWIFILQTYVKSKGYGIYKKVKNKYIDKLIKDIRARYNSHLITTSEAIEVLKQSHKNNEVTITGIVTDQSPSLEKAHFWTHFMGHNIPFHTGAERIAKQLDMGVVFFGVEKVKRGFYQTTFKTIAENPNEFPDYQITEKYKSLVEEQIRKEPNYYLWTHKRWKHKGMEEYCNKIN